MKKLKYWLVFFIPKAKADHPFFLMQETFLIQKCVTKLHVWNSKLL